MSDFDDIERDLYRTRAEAAVERRFIAFLFYSEGLATAATAYEGMYPSIESILEDAREADEDFLEILDTATNEWTFYKNVSPGRTKWSEIKSPPTEPTPR